MSCHCLYYQPKTKTGTYIVYITNYKKQQQYYSIVTKFLKYLVEISVPSNQ